MDTKNDTSSNQGTPIGPGSSGGSAPARAGRMSEALSNWFEWLAGGRVVTERDRNNRSVITAMAIFMLVGTAFLAIFASSTAQGAAVFARLSLIAGATFVTGALIGFLFSIPRALNEQELENSGAAPGGKGLAATREANHTYRVNTNLELVSDWLTKILVGVGLTQIYTLRAELGSLAQSLAQGLQSPATYVPVIASTIIYYAVGGFLAGYMLTRMFLTSAFSRAEDEEQEVVIQHLVNLDPHVCDMPVGARNVLKKIITDPSHTFKAEVEDDYRMLTLLQQHRLVKNTDSDSWDAHEQVTLTPVARLMEAQIKRELEST